MKKKASSCKTMARRARRKCWRRAGPVLGEAQIRELVEKTSMSTEEIVEWHR